LRSFYKSCRARRCRFPGAKQAGSRVSGHIEFGHHADSSVRRVSDNFPDLFLRVKQPVRTHLVQFGKLFGFNAKSLIFG
jgi:hypothetical protein